MYIVPLTGDTIETQGSVAHTVLAYAAYKDAPAVYVQSTGGPETDSVPFTDIQKINGTPVTLTPGKVFKANSVVKRKIQLPQPNDTVKVKNAKFRVTDIKLHERGDLTQGMLLICEDETKNKSTVRLNDIERLIRANEDETACTQVRSTYSEYLGKGSAS